MNAQTKRQPAEEAGHLSISISGNREDVARIIAGMAHTLAGEGAVEPEALYVFRDEASRLTGIPRDQLSGLVKAGHITNYGSPAKMRLSLAEIRAWQEAQR